MMRRNSPPRYMRRNSPPRRGGRPRSLSPLSRSQPAPPGEERGRKSNPWDGQNPQKRPRSRSRSRERILQSRESERERLRARIERGPPEVRITEEEQPRGRFVRAREPPRDVREVTRKQNERAKDRSRERHREHERVLHSPRRGENRNEKPKVLLQKHSLEHNQEYEESYLDHHRNNGRAPHEEPILDPSSITFNTSPPDHPRNIPRDRHTSLTRLGQNMFGKHEKEEKAEDRINRLEKLVEKLVEGNVKPIKPTESLSRHKLAKDIIPELIPSNNQFTTSMWINKIHEECLHRNFDEKSSIRLMQDKMTGIMKAWFKTVSSYDFTWPELKLLITQTFPDNTDFARTLKILVGRDKASDETITQYYFSKVYLCEACKITGENAVSCIIDGLTNPFMKQEIKSFSFLTPEALYSQYLSKFPEQDLPVRMDHREVRIEHREESEFSNQEYIPLEVDNHERDYRMLAPSSSVREERFVNRLAERPIERKPEKQKCFTCKKFGHLAIHCRHAPICYNCEKKGHIAAKCPLTKVMLISSLIDTSVVPVVCCEIKGKKFDGLIDTGAMTVTMKRSVAKNLKLDYINSREILKGYGGSLVLALGEAHINLMVASTERLVKALIVEDKVQKYPLIVGQEFLSKEGVTTLIGNGNICITDAVKAM